MKNIYSKTRDGYNSIKSDIFVSHSHYKLVSDMVGSIIFKKESENLVLDAGCGFGNHAGILSSIVDGTYVGVDVSETAIGKAKLKN